MRALRVASLIGAGVCALSSVPALAANTTVLTVSNSGDGSSVSCGVGCLQVTIGRLDSTTFLQASCGLYSASANITLAQPARITSVKLIKVAYDDWLRFKVGSTIVYNADSAWTGAAARCGENGNRGTFTPNTDLTSYFTGTPAGGSLVLTQDTSYADKGGGGALVEIRFTVAQCDDGIDNDGDGLIDYPADTGCTSASDETETYDTVKGTPCANCSCGVDLNGNGDVSDPGEVQSCPPLSDGTSQCPIGRTACVAKDGGYVCPTNSALACQPTGTGAPTCSPNQCYSAASGGVTTTTIDQPEPADNGPRGADGSCLGVLRVFAGQGMRCRTSGTQTAFQNCCDNKAGVLNDTMGEKGGQTQRDYKKQANAFNVFANQCDIQDQKAAQLAASDYCIYLGKYCAEKWIFGCVQNAKSYCCFNSKLAKLIQEQGRAQLPSMGGFGTVTNPDCKGFTLQEFQSLDFSKIDLSSYTSSFKMDSQTMIQNNAQTNAHTNTGH